MSARPNQSASRVAVIAGAGVTGLAALLVAPPVAHATPAQSPPVTDRVQPAVTDEATTTAAVEPDYGYQKYRVGVRGKDGDYFPDKTTTAGTKLHVVETNSDGTPHRAPFDCITEANDPDVVTDATFCPGEDFVSRVGRRELKGVAEPTPGKPGNIYLADPGVTVKVTQVDDIDNMVRDKGTVTLEPCPGNDGAGSSCREPDPDNEVGRVKSTDLVLVDPGLPPLATDDSERTREGVPVTIKIAPNDDPRAPIKGVKIASDPKNGTAELVTEEEADPSSSSATSTVPAPGTSTITLMKRQPAGTRSLAAVTSYQAVYTPKAGFVGVDSFRYTITTQNGTATAEVRVTVTGTAASSSASASASTTGRDPIAETGTQSGTLIGYAAALLATGGGALALGRQRRRGRHAG